MKLSNHLNAALLQIKNVLAEIIAGDPGSPVEGQFWYNSTTHRLKYRTDSASVTPLIGTDVPGGDIGGTYANMQIAAGAIVNADINAAAAIAYSKLSLGSSIVNTDISPTAAIGYGKLALTNSIVTGDLVDDAVTNAKLAAMGASTFKGRQAGGAGDPEDLTVAQAKTLLNLAGTNTGDQTITLTGDVTGSGTGSFATAIAAGVIVDADINAAAAIALSKLAQNPLDRSLHTGTQASTTISDFTSAVQSVVNANSGFNAIDPTAAGHLATKNYVDNAIAGLGWHDSVRVVTTGTPAFVGLPTIDGVTVAAGDRVLVANNAATAGIWVAAVGSWTRATDADSANDLRSAAVFVEEGTTNAGTAWVMTTDPPITVGTTALGWVKFSSGLQWVVSSGLVLVGNTLSVSAGTGITTAGGGVEIDTTIVVRKYAVNCAAATSTTVTHNLNTRDVIVQIYDTATFEEVEADVVMTSVNVVTVTFASAPAAGAYRIVVHA